VLERTRIRVSSCPAVFSLVGRLGPELLAGKDIEILTTDSTALAAKMVHAGLAEVAVTNEMSVSKYGLTFLSEVPGVEMLWSVFRRRE
jgi:prephenate dehydratase